MGALLASQVAKFARSGQAPLGADPASSLATIAHGRQNIQTYLRSEFDLASEAPDGYPPSLLRGRVTKVMTLYASPMQAYSGARRR